MKRVWICILAALLLSSTACNGDTVPETEPVLQDPVGVKETEPAETGRASIKDTLPDDLWFDWEQINCIHRPESQYYDAEGENGGDIVLDAVYNRNVSVEERLGIKLNYIVTDTSDIIAAAQQIYNSVMADSDEYDIIMQRGHQCSLQSMQGLYIDLSHNEYINLSQPWWWEKAILESSVKTDKIYFLTGDISLSTFLYSTSCYFNKDMMADYAYSPDDLYDTVRNGKWTYDVFEQYCTGIYNDLDGDGTASAEDIYAFQWLGWNANYFVFSAGISFTERDANGYPVLNINTDKNTRYLEKLNHLLHEEDYAYSLPSQDYNEMIELFSRNKSLFMMGRLNAATTFFDSNLRNMESPYGIIPYPKFDEADPYMSGIGVASGAQIAVPVTCKSIAPTTAAIEAMCAENYRTVFPALYETALKQKYADTPDDAQMIDIIHDSISTDFSHLASLPLGSLIFELANVGSNNLASRYASGKASYEKALQDLITTYEQMNS